MKKWVWIVALIVIAYLMYQRSKIAKKSPVIPAGLGYPSFNTDLHPSNMPQAVIM